MKITEKRISEILRRLGMPVSLKGFQYIKKAIELISEDESELDCIVKKLYPDIAECFPDSTSTRVERAIRHAIEVTFEKGSLSEIEIIFSNAYSCEKGKPTNSEFLACLYEYMKFEADESEGK